MRRGKVAVPPTMRVTDAGKRVSRTNYVPLCRCKNTCEQRELISVERALTAVVTPGRLEIISDIGHNYQRALFQTTTIHANSKIMGEK